MMIPAEYWWREEEEVAAGSGMGEVMAEAC